MSDLGHDVAELVTPDTLAVLVVNLDARGPSGMRADVRAQPGLTRAMFAAVLRQVANAWDPPLVVDLSAEHLPECDCSRCH